MMNRKSKGQPVEPVSGHLEILDKGFGFLRDIDNNYQAGQADTFVPAFMITKFGLREGSFIEGRGGPGNPGNQNLKLTAVDRVNGLSLDDYARTETMHTMTSINPEKRLRMAQGPKDITGQALDIIVPMGRGQRGLIISPPKSGKTTLLRHMANSVTANDPEMGVFILLVNERPEEVTDFKRGLKDAHVLYSSADQSIGQHMRMTRLAVHTAMRCAEVGRDTVVFIDSLTRMARAFNAETESYGRTLSGGLGANAMEVPRKIFGAARNIENGGSLTIIATILVETGSRMDDIIYQEFKGTGNMDLVLSRDCAEHRVFPAIDIRLSGTRKEELLLNKDELKKAVDIRRALSRKDPTEAMAELIEYLDRNGR
ncbi:transcription termination factor Rho [Desulfosarcina alkanivorans]|uniref:transcription termination factor Rho n=1 Tax=Desulfosarcina alkanivorans TaxID=571177 RepID=UPI001E368805|nr:transcription termination factor Rho [Desulfosarcina alkanivorans]